MTTDMLTRKHPHARDLLRRARKEFRFRPTTPRSICGEFIAERLWIPPGELQMDAGTKRDLLGWSRNLQAVLPCPLP